MRNAFIRELVAAAEQNSKIVLVVGDLGYGVVEPFAERFPDRFFNSGVAEQNMMGIASGLASEGYQVFVYSIANFPLFRCAEQIRNDVDYHGYTVTIVSVGGGVAYGNMGYSHHAVQDYALVRSLPNMLIASPGDPNETSACVRYLLSNPQPSYLRLGKAGEPIINQHISADLQPGEWQLIHEAANPIGTILSTGAILETAHRIVTSSNELMDQWSINSLPLWSMKLKEIQIEQLRKYKKIITVEDHQLDGGFGSWLLEAAMQYDKELISRIQIKALNSEIYNVVAKQSTLNKLGGLEDLFSL